MLDIDEFLNRYDASSERTVAELSSSRRTEDLIRGRVELTLLAIGRYGFQSAVVAKLIKKDRSSLTRWLNLGLQLQRNDRSFREHIDNLDRRIGRQKSTTQQ